MSLSHSEPLPGPALSATKSIIEPVLDGIFESGSEDTKLPEIDNESYMRGYTACYKHLLGCTPRGPRGFQFYQFVDEYFKQRTEVIASSVDIRANKLETIRHLLQEFDRYQARTRVVARMLICLDRFYVEAVIRDNAQTSTAALSHIIPTFPLAMRRFRTDVLEPLVLSSDEMKEWIKLNVLSPAEHVNDEAIALSESFKEMLRRTEVVEDMFL